MRAAANTRWSADTGASGMDDMAEHASQRGKVTEAELDAVIAGKRRDARAAMLSGIGCTGRPRLGPLTRLERRMLRRRSPSFAWAVVVLLAVVCFVQQVWP